MKNIMKNFGWGAIVLFVVMILTNLILGPYHVSNLKIILIELIGVWGGMLYYYLTITLNKK